MNTEFKKLQRTKLWNAIFAGTVAMTWLTATSVVQASDLQIYAVPKAGKKTLIMMLDTSGSMAFLTEDYGSVCPTDWRGNETISTETGGDSVYSYTRRFCSVSYNTSSASNYQRLKDRCFNPNKNADGTPSTGTAALKCYDRISRLKDGMFGLLNSSDAAVSNSSTGTQVRLSTTVMGLGNFSSDGDGQTGQILVAAKPLGAVGSAQRNALKSAIAGLTAYNGTPSAHAMAEAAAYLMGTTTYSEQNYNIKRDTTNLIRSYSTTSSGSGSSKRYTYTYTYNVYTCNRWNSVDLNSSTQTCNRWGNNPVVTTGTTTNATSGSNPLWANQPNIQPSNGWLSSDGFTAGDYYTYIVSNADSGTPKSKVKDTTTNPDIVMDRNAANVDVLYKSPLPTVTNRASCDGQGIYFLSDGQPNSSSDSRALNVMQKALDTKGSLFQCSNDLSNTDGSSAWRCMGAFAKALFNPATNPVGVSIKTAFVGFGKEFEASSVDATGVSTDTQNACRMSSRAYRDPLTQQLPNDKCSPTYGGSLMVTAPTAATSTDTYKTADGYRYDGGYGNGGFFQASSANDVTNSVVAFIKNLGGATLDPITTGPISVPYDALNPKNLQENGYLRALEPDPANTNLSWRGNLKKYSVVLSGATAGAFQGSSGGLVYDAKGAFTTGTKDYWNTSSYVDGGKVFLGGAYSKVPLPILGQTEEVSGTLITKYAYSASNKIRNLFTDVSAVSADDSSLTPSTGLSTGAIMLQIPEKPAATATDPFTSPAATSSYVLGKLNTITGQGILKDFPLSIKLKLLNFLGYSTSLDATTLPTSLTTSDAPYLSMGGSIHSAPVQLTYSGTMDSSGNLTSARDQSILFGTMEGGLHIVDASSGEEQMVFVPAEILNHPIKSKALVPGQTDASAPVHGVDGAWVSDATYKVDSEAGANNTTVTKVLARRMNVYGGLRMGGSSYYGLDVLAPKNPKLLFRIDPSTTGFERLGQSWSKPVMANIRYNGAITRVMIVGGGYDACYEDPNFTLASTSGNGSTCATTSEANGNAVYIVNAQTGDLIWSATYASTATDGRQYMKHSIVSRISTLDRNADGLIDHLYFGDLGGQIFRADLNNKQTLSGSTYSAFGVRVVRLANLATDDATNDPDNSYIGGKAPRFYEPPTVTIHDQGKNTFILVGIASGNRAAPLDVFPATGREGLTPASAMTDRPVNNVYGIIDRDFINKDLMTVAYTDLITKDKTRANLRKNPQIVATTESVETIFFPSSGSGKDGWYRSLSSQNTATTGLNNVERAQDGTFRMRGGLKAFEEPMALTGYLLVPVYDPQGTGIEAQDPCKPRVIGETDFQRFCLPFGACLTATGALDTDKERRSGFQTKTTDCPTGVTECNSNILGAGIRGVSFVPKAETTTTSESCGRLSMAGNIAGTGEWKCTSKFIPTRWYERYR
ncbi:pilus assembly protein PilY [Acinetobacter sp. SFB]|uniref:PilC/PilY family type IV pilus protein n=1 Tax=Acinetobacter sp. SFB TaxID=1805634 RepID=UPI0007D825D4|nr:PilC/PilY family type IV pilus protein [Acinetobacter sp. SFB]OAL77833.1 pilus assembly protein PilY [Acinetobacter sp. SFB]